jgi:Transposase
MLTNLCLEGELEARKLMEFGHTVKLIAPQFVKPYVKTNKNDAADAEAICEAVGRPNMRFVPIKNTEQQALLGLHRVRQGFVTERTAQANQIRGLLAEFGLVIPVGIRCIERRLPEFLEDAENGLSGASRALFARIKGSSPSLKRRGPHGIKVPRLSLRINLNQRRGTHEPDYYCRCGARVRFSDLGSTVDLISIVPIKNVPLQRVVTPLERCSSTTAGLSAQPVVDAKNNLFGEPVGPCTRTGKDRASLETRSECEADC